MHGPTTVTVRMRTLLRGVGTCHTRVERWQHVAEAVDIGSADRHGRQPSSRPRARGEGTRRGLTDRQIGGRVVSGRWERVAASVFRIAGAPATDVQRTYAAVLCGWGRGARGWSVVARSPRGRTSSDRPDDHTAAGRERAHRWGSHPAVTIGPTRPHPSRSRSLHDSVQGPARGRRHRELVHARGTARRGARPALVHPRGRRQHDPARTQRVRARGAPSLRAALEPWLGGMVPGSPAETRLIRRLSDWGLPDPVLQYRVALALGSHGVDRPGVAVGARRARIRRHHGAHTASACTRRRSRGSGPSPWMVDRTC